jgi:3-oxoadipate enol-lactonase
MPTVRANGIDVYYELHGDGEPLLLIGGLGTELSAYKEVIRRLSQRYRVLGFDNRGVGRTDKPRTPYMIELMADDTADLVGALSMAPVHVLGHSMGGRIAMELALQHPELVRRLVLISTSPCVPRNVRTSLELKLGKFTKLVTGSGLFGKGPQPYYAFVRQMEASRGYDCTGRLSQVEIPTFVMHGRKDGLVPYELAEDMHARIGGSKMVTFDGGHLFLFREVERATDTISEFLSNGK